LADERILAQEMEKSRRPDALTAREVMVEMIEMSAEGTGRARKQSDFA
jgi:hypothetical protein